jgi:hypothetical protein
MFCPGVDGVHHGFDDLVARLRIVAVHVKRARRPADFSDDEPVLDLDLGERHDVEDGRDADVLERRRMVGDQDEARRQALAVLLVQPQVDVERPHETPAPRWEEPGDGVGSGPRQPGEEIHERRVENEVRPADDFSQETQHDQHGSRLRSDQEIPHGRDLIGGHQHGA